MENSEKVHFSSCSALCNSSPSLTFALLSSLQQYFWEYILFVLLAPEVSSIRRLWSVNMAFNPVHLAHIVVTAQPSVQLSPCTKVSIQQLATDSLFRKFNICKSYTSWLYFSPIIIIMMFGMCGYSFFFFFFSTKEPPFLPVLQRPKWRWRPPWRATWNPGPALRANLSSPYPSTSQRSIRPLHPSPTSPRCL